MYMKTHLCVCVRVIVLVCVCASVVQEYRATTINIEPR